MNLLRPWLVLMTAVLSGGAAWGQDESSTTRPPAPRWIPAEVRLVEIKAGSPELALLPSWPVTFEGDGRLLYGPTAGYVASSGTGVWFRPYRAEVSTEGIFRIEPGEHHPLPMVYGSGKPVDVPVEVFEEHGRWRYRFPFVLEVATDEVRLCFLDGDGDGWFDDLDRDRVALGPAQDLRRMKFVPFPGEVEVGGQRYLVSANPREALLWPVSHGVRRDYVRHIAEINAVRRYGGLPPAGLAEELTTACEAHSAYCGNWGLTHHEDPGLRGYSRAGAWAGLHSNIAPGVNAIAGIRLLMRTLWHRNHYFHPALLQVGVGAAADVVTSDVLTHAAAATRELIFAPMDHALDAPTAGENEIPSPYAKEERPGPFVTVLLPQGTEAAFRAGSVTPRGGKPVPFDVTDPTHPAPGSIGQVPDNDSCIVLILQRTLAPETIYDVKVSATFAGAEREFSWSFRTRAEK